MLRARTSLIVLLVGFCTAAHAKAEAMAAALGCKVGAVLTIEEPQPRNPWNNGSSNVHVIESRTPADIASETFVPGAMEVSVTVSVTFELAP